MTEVTIPLRSQEEAILVLGPYDRHAKLMREALEIEIWTRNGNLRLRGADTQVEEARQRVDHLLGKHRKGRELDTLKVEHILLGSPPDARATTMAKRQEAEQKGSASRPSIRRPKVGSATAMGVRTRPFEPRSENQRRYLETIAKSALTLGIGAAGTGKTFLAVGAAVRALRNGECRRLIITRPVVEAGEHLGFLPGDFQAKLDPYLRPVYDALNTLLDPEDVINLEESQVIEVAPLAYMRGRTLSHAFVILDEAQNTTVSQMKMFLTRLGENSKMVVTGDPSQTDLDRGDRNGLSDAMGRLRGLQDIGFVEFAASDIVRHPLVESIVRAYEHNNDRDRDKDRRRSNKADRRESADNDRASSEHGEN